MGRVCLLASRVLACSERPPEEVCQVTAACPACRIARALAPRSVVIASFGCRAAKVRSNTNLCRPMLRCRLPAIEPYEHGMLDVGDEQRVYWEVSGSPGGKPTVVLHGGPGSGSSAGRRRWFDPSAYRIVQFDQRGCGRSTPPVSDPATDLSTNTTHHLVADIEHLREHLDIEQWLVCGVSWGVTLGLAYAEGHPERIRSLGPSRWIT
jgi:hypothetical protein